MLLAEGGQPQPSWMNANYSMAKYEDEENRAATMQQPGGLQHNRYRYSSRRNAGFCRAFYISIMNEKATKHSTKQNRMHCERTGTCKVIQYQTLGLLFVVA